MTKKYIIQPICNDCIWIKDNVCKCPNCRRFGMIASYMRCEYYTLKTNDNCLDCQFFNLNRMMCGKETAPLFKKKVLEPDACKFFVLAKPKKLKLKKISVNICRAKHCPWLVKCGDKKGTCLWQKCLMED